MSGWGSKPVWPSMEWPKATLDKADTLKIEHINRAKEYLEERSNLPPAHDPYRNPNSHIYYECKCGAILDPNTKSFAALNNYASEKGWKVRWRQDGAGYEPFCVECGKDVE